MPHADEGQIHAYLDRQGEFADPMKRRELGKHIADCSRCTRVLKEARRLRSEAEELLRTTRLREVQAPPFAEIAARAEARNQPALATPRVRDRTSSPSTVVAAPHGQRRHAFRVWRSLAWAATVVLAVGIGWSIRPLLVGRADSAPAAALLDTGSAEARADDERLTEAVELADESMVRRRERDAPSVDEPAAIVPPAAAPPVQRAETATVGAGRADSQGMPTLATAASNIRAEAQRMAVLDSIRPADSLRAVRRRGVVTTEIADAIDSATVDSSRVVEERERMRAPETGARAARDIVAQPQAEPAPAPMRFDSDRTRLPGDWNVITREEAEATLGGPLVWVPDLEIVGLGRTVTPNGVRLMQSAGETLLELEIRAILPVSAGNRDATRPTRIRVLPGETSESSTGTATIGRYLITAKAAFPEASLRRFLERLTYAAAPDQLRDY